jgi:PAS domain-containing protein
LRLVEGNLFEPIEWSWFCGHCAAPSPGGEAPAPNARVCAACGLGLLLETRADALPDNRDAFLVIDSRLTVQAVSRRAEKFLDIAEEEAVNRPVAELLVPADAEAGGSDGFVAAIMRATGSEDDPRRVSVRPTNTFGVRLRAAIAPCGPPRAALLVLDVAGSGLRIVGH